MTGRAAGPHGTPGADQQVLERPVLSFSRYGIALHFPISAADVGSAPEGSDAFGSFERDLLSYAYRSAPPFGSRVVRVPDGLRRVALCLPGRLRYVSEGLTVDLVCAHTDPSGGRRRAVRVRASRTDFRSGLAVLHLVLSPDADTDATTLHEYDLVKLVKLWEGGEGVGADSARRIDQALTFEPAGGRALGVVELARAAFGLSTVFADLPRLGTIQVLMGERLIMGRLAWADVLRGIQALRTGAAEGVRPSRPDDRELLLRAIKGTGGILQGLLDFDRVETTELADVFGESQVAEDRLTGVHKGTLLALAETDRAFDASQEAIGVSPYLLAPHAVLAHNDEMLNRADRAARRAAPGTPGALAAVRREMQLALDRHRLPNVFHYPTERSLYVLGATSRGLGDREQALRASLEEIKAEWETRIAKQRRIAEDLITALLLVVSGGEFIDARYPAEYVLPLLGVAGLAYFLWRRLL